MVTNNNGTSLIYKIAIGIASFLLILMVSYFASSIVAVQRFGNENRERIVKLEQIQLQSDRNQQDIMRTQERIIVSLADLDKSLTAHMAKEK